MTEDIRIQGNFIVPVVRIELGHPGKETVLQTSIEMSFSDSF